MKLNKIVLSSVIGLTLALPVGNSHQANAATTEQAEMNVNTDALTEVNGVAINDNTVIVPLVDWSGNAYLTRNVWSTVMGSNNIFKDTPTITNVANNPGTAKFRIVNGNGVVIAESGYVSPGSSTSLGPIPAFSGTYTLQANVEVTGYYNIKVD